MTADTPAATATADPNAAPDPTAAQATTATDATTPDGSQATPQEGAQASEAKTDAGDKPDAQAAPESYTFTMPEGREIDSALADSVTPILREAGVSQEAAQKLAQALVEHMEAKEARVPEVYAEMRKQEVETLKTQWREAITADKELGGPNAQAIQSRVLAAVGECATPEFKAAMDEHGWGNHPELIRFINRCIDYVPPETGERAASGGGTKNVADALFGHLPSALG